MTRPSDRWKWLTDVVNEVREPSGSPLPVIAQLGRYEVRELIGRGGMGHVFRAYDAILGRDVALKVVPETCLHRLRREAKAAARLRHPGIVPVFDLGEADGVTFLVMELVEGETLAHAWGRWTLRERVAALIRVGQAVEHAHQEGIVHRDLKPGNVMVSAAGDVRVMDFGLASVEGESALTAVGEMLGTPEYMAPEQIRGQRAGPAADIYALGMMLYEALTGSLPFQAPHAFGVFPQILKDDPPPIPKGQPGELDVVCRKALEKEACRRYRSIGEMVDELDRWMRGEPIRTRPSSWSSKVIRRVRRNPWAWAVGSAAGIVVLVAAVIVLGVVSATSGRIRVEREAAIRQMREVVRARLDVALEKRRAGKLDEMRQQATAVEDACREVLRKDPGLAEPHYQLGRMYRALMMWEEALAEQDWALAMDPADPRARYERGLLRLRNYLSRLERGPTNPALGYYRDRVLEDLRRAPDELVARALVAFLEDRREEAARLFAEAHERDPYLEEPYLWLSAMASDPAEKIEWLSKGIARDRGHLPFWWGRARARVEQADGAFRGTCDDPLPLYGEALEDYAQALALDEGHPEPWIGCGVARANWGSWLQRRGEDPSALYEAALADYEKASERAPRADEPFLRRGELLTNWALFPSGRGEDPRELCEEGLAFLDRALALDPSWPDSWVARGDARVNWALYLSRRGEDTGEMDRAALDDFGEALDRDPALVDAWMGRGLARTNMGNRLRACGRDPTDLYRAALGDFAEARRLGIGAGQLGVGRGIARLNWAGYVLDRGEDPGDLLRQAWEDFSFALACDPGSEEAWRGRGAVGVNMGVSLRARGEDPSPCFSAAVGDLQQALRLNPSWAEAWVTLGVVYRDWGLAVSCAGGDPADRYEQATRALEEAVRLNPGNDGAWLRLGDARMNQAERAAARGEDPSGLLDAAIQAYGRALDENDRRDETWLARGTAWSSLATWRLRLRADATTPLVNAVEDFGEALLRNPERVETWTCRARARAAQGISDAGAFESALSDCEEALKRAPSSAGPWEARALVRAQRAHWVHSQGGDASALYAGAIEDYSEAARRDPRSLEAWKGLGEARVNWSNQLRAQTEDPRPLLVAAIEDYTRALRLNPSLGILWVGLGTARTLLADAPGATGEETRRHLAAAIEDLSQAIRIDASDPEALWRRGYCRLLAGDASGAMGDFETTIRVAPAYGPLLDRWITRCRQRLAECEF